jgi:hypothetical protein
VVRDGRLLDQHRRLDGVYADLAGMARGNIENLEPDRVCQDVEVAALASNEASRYAQ